jgi:hypothetical protein
VGIHAHNPLGITFARDVYAHLYGRYAEPVNAAEFRRMITHPVLRQHKGHLKIIVGGPGSWQIEKKELQNEWLIDCIVDGEAEDVTVSLFEAAVRGEVLPRKVIGQSPALEHIPRIRRRSTLGVVEITRGCGRGCDFCSVALRRGKSIPLEQILDNVRTQVAEGADSILLTTEDVFLYEQGPKFETNVPALRKLFRSVADVPGVRYVMQTHGTIAPVVLNPGMLDELSPVAVGNAVGQHKASTHPDKRFANLFIGLETGSVRLFREHMKGKALHLDHRTSRRNTRGHKRVIGSSFCASRRQMGRYSDALRSSGRNAAGTTRPSKQEACRAHGSAVGILFHLLALQPGFLPQYPQSALGIQSRHSDLLLLAGTPAVWRRGEVSAVPIGARSRAFTASQALPGFVQR